MIKRRKDGGFTLIELMIVIAVIGILAVVLAPKFGEVKSEAKNAGVETNLHTAQIYVEANIDKWTTTSKTAADIETELNTLGMTNPFGSGAVVTTSGSAAGTILVSASGSGSNYQVTLQAFDDDGNSLRSITLKPYN